MPDNYFRNKRMQREAAQGPVRLTPGDPTMPAKTTKANNEARASELSPAQAAADLRSTNIENILKEMKIAEAKAALKKEEEDRKAREDDAAAAKDAKSAALQKVENTIRRLDEIERDAADNGGWFETGKSGSFARNWMGEGTPAYDLDRKVQGVRGANFVEAIRQLKEASKTGSTGAGGLTETEGKKLEDALAVLDPNMSHQEFMDQVSQARNTYLESYRRMGGSDRTVDPKADTPSDQLPADRQQIATGDRRSVADPYLRAVAGRVGSMIADPRVSDERIRGYLESAKVPNGSTNIDEVLKYRRSPDFLEWRRRNPGKPYNVGESFYTKDVPMSGAQGAMNALGGSALGAYTANAANALTVNQMGNVMGEQARTGLASMREENPIASMLGDASGQLMFEGGAGRLPGVRGLAGRRFSALGADLAYGAGAGLGEDPSLSGALSGGLGGAAGGILGRNAVKGIGAAAKGINNPSLSYLRDQGVPLTIGQIGRGSEGTLGKAVAWTEDRLAGLPGADAIINSARRRGQDGFNKAAFREIGTDQTGSAGIAAGENAVDNAYSFLDNANMSLDAPYAGTAAGIRASLPNLPKWGPEIGNAMNTIDRASMGGDMAGRDWQSALRATRADRASLKGQPFSDGGIGAIDDIEQNLLGLAGRQGPPNTIGQLSDANALNMKFQTLNEALDNGPAQRGDEMFNPMRLDAASRAARRKFGGRTASMKGDRPFYQLTRAGMDAMPNDVPDSGTAGRALLYSGILSGVGGLGGAGVAPDGSEAQGAAIGSAPLALAGGLAALYSEPAQRKLGQMLLGPRSPFAKKAGNILTDPRMVKASGGIGEAIARSLLLYPDL